MSTAAVVTGAAGFVGRRLCARMRELGWEVTGITLSGQRTDIAGVQWAEGDVTDPDFVSGVVAGARPRYLVHLAAQSSVAVSGAAAGAAATVRVNVGGAAAVLAAVAATPEPASIRLLMVGSAEEYGAWDAARGPIPESAPLAPLNPYAASKVCQEVLALQYARSDGLDVVLTRSFNHTGPGQAARFLVPSLVARTLALRSAGGGELVIGNPHVVRDFLHVDDVVEAYLALLERGGSGIAYNVCSEEGWAVGEVAELVLRAAGVTARVVTTNELSRRVDAPYLVGRNERIRDGVGWKPARTLERAVAEMVAPSG